MELTQLRYFLEVASSQHITHSAEKLNIAQPALTQTIHRLQDEIGVPLFVARGRNVVLSEYGRVLQRSIAPLIAELDKIPEQLRRMAKLEANTVRLNVLAASTLVTEAILAYKKQSALNFAVFQNGAEMFDISISTAPAGKRAESDFVLKEKIFLAVPKDRFNAEKVSPDEVRDEGFICLMGSKNFRSICDKYCMHLGFKPKVIFESDNPTAVRNVIAANMGVGFWPEFTWGAVDAEKVRLVEIAGAPLYRDILISCGTEASGPVKDFYEFLKSFFIRAKEVAAGLRGEVEVR